MPTQSPVDLLISRVEAVIDSLVAVTDIMKRKHQNDILTPLEYPYYVELSMSIDGLRGAIETYKHST